MLIKNLSPFVLCFLLLFAIGCDQTQKPILDATGDDGTVSVSPDEIPPDETELWGNVVINDTGPDAIGQWGTDNYQLDSATITVDTLTLTLSYGGGCETHQFTLVASNVFMESEPVQLAVSLSHNANNDSCERWVMETYHFDLTPIKIMYQKVYQEDAGSVVLRLEEAPEDFPALVYDFVP